MGENEKTTRVCANTQYFSAISANLIMVGFGCTTGWLSMALPLLRSEETPLESGKMSLSDLSWIASVIALGALTGNCLFGFIVTIIGTRHTIFSIGFPQLVSWLFLIFGTYPLHLAISRFLGGFVLGGAQTCIFLYLAEIADSEIRGKLGTIFSHARNIGILFAFTIGSYFDYVTASMYFTGITIIFLVAIWFVPSTPQYFLRKNKFEAAQESFNFYNKHRLETDPKLCSNQFENLKLVASDVDSKSKMTWKDIVKSRYGFLQAIMFPLMNCNTAQIIFLTYGTIIIQKSGTHLPSGGSSIFMAVVQLVAGLITYKLIDRKGRRFLLIVSLVGCTLSHAILVAYLYLKNHDGFGEHTSIFQWTPVLCMASIIFMSSIGIQPLTFICMAESFPSKMRPFGMTFGSIVINIFAFILFKMYPLVEQVIGISNTFLFFCISCAIGTIYVAIFVQETKGKDLNK